MCIVFFPTLLCPPTRSRGDFVLRFGSRSRAPANSFFSIADSCRRKNICSGSLPLWLNLLYAPTFCVQYPFQWGALTFDAGEAFAMMTASFVALLECTGAFIAVSRLKHHFTGSTVNHPQRTPRPFSLVTSRSPPFASVTGRRIR